MGHPAHDDHRAADEDDAGVADRDAGDDVARDTPDAYLDHGLLVFTAAYHLRRGFCCGSGCRHCPFDPPHTTGTTQVRQ